MLTCIIVSSVALASYDFSDRDSKTLRNKIVDRIGQVLIIVFSLEALMKIIAQGFLLHEKAYLRDPWNWIDFAVVISGYLPLYTIC